MGIIISPTDWDDWRWAGQGVNPPGTAAPAVLTEITTDEWEWVFVNNTVKAFPSQQMPHPYKEGTDVIPHIHWAPTTTGTYTGVWTAIITSYLSSAPGEVKEPKLTVTQSFNAAMTAGDLQSADFSANLPGAGRKISSLATITLKLALSSGVGCALRGFDCHYQKDRLGSAQATSKT